MLPQVSHSHSVRWLHVFLGISLLLTGVVLCHFRCLTAASWDGSTWSQVSYCCSLEWLCVFPSFLFPFTLVAPVLPDVPLLLTGMPSRCSGCFTATHLGGSMSPQMSHCCSLRWFCFFLGVSLPLPMVVWHCSSYLTATHWGRLVFSSSVPLLFTVVASHCSKCHIFADLSGFFCFCPRYPTAFHLGGSASFQLSHF